MGVGLALILKGLRLYFKTDLSWRWTAAPCAVAMVPPGYYAVVEPSLPARVCVTGLYFGLLNVVCATALIRSHAERVVWVSLVGFMVLAITLLLRGGYILVHLGSNHAPVETMENISLLAIQMSQICIALGLMVAACRS